MIGTETETKTEPNTRESDSDPVVKTYQAGQSSGFWAKLQAMLDAITTVTVNTGCGNHVEVTVNVTLSTTVDDIGNLRDTLLSPGTINGPGASAPDPK